ncbi:hypothetical protein DERP_003448 [Dermatophagoides pteronyssinus]|uniref:Uncharacterized protein n=1 Tax=Dermatophagoides pteronyssinus TaxID=6956 RepID=A0ABQ8JJI6_DERPT|nr:hypothetical protein DERP_003448 [Dermatophagoides pteronyssinus]
MADVWSKFDSSKMMVSKQNGEQNSNNMTNRPTNRSSSLLHWPETGLELEIVISYSSVVYLNS